MNRRIVAVRFDTGVLLFGDGAFLAVTHAGRLFEV